MDIDNQFNDYMIIDYESNSCIQYYNNINHQYLLEELTRIVNDKNIALLLYNSVINCDIEYLKKIPNLSVLLSSLIKIAICNDKIDFVKYFYDNFGFNFNDANIYSDISMALENNAENVLKYFLLKYKHNKAIYIVIINSLIKNKNNTSFNLFKKMLYARLIDCNTIKNHLQNNNYEIIDIQEILDIINKIKHHRK